MGESVVHCTSWMSGTFDKDLTWELSIFDMTCITVFRYGTLQNMEFIIRNERQISIFKMKCFSAS